MTADLGIVVVKIREYILSRSFIYLLCLSITLVYLVVVHYLMCLLIHIWILLFIIVGRSRFQLSVERSGKGKVIINQSVRFAFVSHLTNQFVVILLNCAGSLMLVMV